MHDIRSGLASNVAFMEGAGHLSIEIRERNLENYITKRSINGKGE